MCFVVLSGLCVAAQTLIPYPHRVVKPKMSHLSREKLDLVNRTKKIVGQLEGVERALNEDEPCMDVLQRLSAARGAINSLMGELMEDHIRNHMPRKTKSSEEAADDLIEIVRTYLK
jgi:DNA-binding FrmR family transcriptional regulator